MRFKAPFQEDNTKYLNKKRLQHEVFFCVMQSVKSIFLDVNIY